MQNVRPDITYQVGFYAFYPVKQPKLFTHSVFACMKIKVPTYILL